MDLTPAEAAAVIEWHDCSQCQAPAGSPCRTRSGLGRGQVHALILSEPPVRIPEF